MAPPPVVSRIVGVIDPSVDRAYASLERRAEKASRVISASARYGAEEATKAIQREVARQQALMNRAAQAQDRLYNRNALAAAKGQDAATRGAERSAERRARAAERASEREAKAAARSATAFANSFAQIAAVATREMAKVERAQARASARAGERFAGRVSYGAVRFLTPHAPLASIARRTSSELARGLGVDFDLSSSVRRGVDLESAAVALSNQGYEPGQAGPNGQRVDSGSLMAQARGINQKYGTLSSSAALGGLERFVTKTGDLQTGRDVLESMARAAVATGAGLESAVDAAGDVSLALGNMPNKGAEITRIMNTIAGQGKLGAVELKDNAVQMAKIASSASQFEGSVGDNITTLGAFAQVARARGGAASASIAGTSIAAFTNTLKTPARVAAFKKEGIDVYNKAGKIRSPEAILLASLEKTGGDPLRLKKMFANVQGARAVEGFANIYRDAGGGGKGLDAVKSEIARFKNSTLNEKAAQESIDAANQTTAAKAQQFQERLDQVANKVRERLVPAFDELAPKLLDFADVLGQVTTWTISNPKQAIAMGLGVSIARSVAENTVRAGIESVLLGRNGENASTVGKVAGAAGGVMTIAALAVTTFTVANMLVDHFNAEEKETADAARKKLEEADVKSTQLRKEADEAAAHGDTDTQRKKLEEALALRRGASKDGGSALEETERTTFFGRDRVTWQKELLDNWLGHDKGEKNEFGQTSETDGLFNIRKLINRTDADIDKGAKEAAKSTDGLRASNEKNTQALVALTQALSGFGDGRKSQL